jgi:N-methylhydantoinase B/oxoprolinase/acetone carboxylase alpha subunit
VRLTSGETVTDLEAMSRLDLTQGDSIRIQTAGGGGYGTPKA